MGPKKGNGATIGAIVVIIVLLAGAWYMWHNRTTATGDEPAVENQVGDLDSADSQESSLNNQSSSDDINSIDADAHATDVSSI